MKIEELTLRNFRNYREFTLIPHEGVNLFFGQNGSGKTNLLEAVHYCCLGKSHRTSNDANVVKIGNNDCQCGLSVRNALTRRSITVRIQPNEAQKKTILIDQKKIHRFSDMMGCLRCVIFSPEDLGLIREGPSLRRRYLDMMISQLNRGYFIALQQYRNGVEQRNALLRAMRANPSMDREMLGDFEQALAGPAAVITAERQKIVSLLADLARDTYQELSGGKEEFGMAYHSSLREAESAQEELLRQLRESREEDIRTGLTSAGPHRDDLNLTLNRKSMKQFASQGQVRTAALCLKLAQMKALDAVSGDRPVLLLDDVMSELDRGRRTRLIREIGEYQTFITCTDESDVEYDLSKRVYQVSSVDGEALVTESNRGEETEKPVLEEPDFR